MCFLKYIFFLKKWEELNLEEKLKKRENLTYQRCVKIGRTFYLQTITQC